MHNDPIISTLLSERNELLDNVARIDQMIEMRNTYLGVSGKQQSVKVVPLKGENKPIPRKMSSELVAVSPRSKSASNGIMRATQQAALELIDSGKGYVTTREVIAAKQDKGHVYPSAKPSKNASSYLKSCKELENFPLNAEKRQFAWRRKRVTEHSNAISYLAS